MASSSRPWSGLGRFDSGSCSTGEAWFFVSFARGVAGVACGLAVLLSIRRPHWLAESLPFSGKLTQPELRVLASPLRASVWFLSLPGLLALLSRTSLANCQLAESGARDRRVSIRSGSTASSSIGRLPRLPCPEFGASLLFKEPGETAARDWPEFESTTSITV